MKYLLAAIAVITFLSIGSSASAQAVESILSDPVLSVTIGGTGGGSVNSSPAGIACTGGPCSEQFSDGSSITLLATPNSDSLFNSWSGDCTGIGNCTVIMNGSKNVTASFSHVPPVRVPGTQPLFYAKVGDAYAVATGGLIQMREFQFQEDLVLNRPISVLLRGGYNAAYSGNSNVSTIDGTLRIAQGSVRVDRVVMRSATPTGTLSGYVWFWQGNFMPIVGGTRSGTITPVVRLIYIYEVTSVDPVSPGGYFSNIPTNLVATTSSDTTGYYHVALPPGEYSVFVMEPSGLYATRGDGQGRVNPVTIPEYGTTTLDIDIRYAAYF